MSATRVAHLGMYDAPFLQAANDALWAGVARRLKAAGLAGVPERLDRGRTLSALWRDPALLLAQTCGYPLVTALREAVTVVGAPVYDLPGCVGATHRSVVVVAADAPFARLPELRGARAALNGRDSNTGMNLLRHAVAPLAEGGRFFGGVVETGAHLDSLAAVAEGRADVAAVDCVTFGLAARHRPEAVAGVRIITETAPSPSLPFVTAGGADPDTVAPLLAALNVALSDPALAGAAEALALRRVEPAGLSDYAVLLDYERDAAARGYAELA